MQSRIKKLHNMIAKSFKSAVVAVALAAGLMVFQSCDSLNNTQKGAGIGAAAGGVIGALVGKKLGNTAVGALAGAAIGGTAGGFIGKRMDKQAEELKKQIPGAEVIREGEGIIVRFDSGILFDFNKTDLKDAAKVNIQSLASSLNNYPGTDVKIIGHTDNVGTAAVNQSVSEKRAAAVKAYAVAQGVPTSRLVTEGKGLTEPVADNNTDAGRAANRRVEIVIVANKDLKAEAQKNAG
jgi:outer membrane protein OmpA-like peptidoglycan-associated protein